MSEIRELSLEEKSFIDPYLPHVEATTSDSTTDENHTIRPFVTLTYACSLDGMISHGPGLRTTLSGPETKSMTHYLRLHHDAILVGVGTLEADDPSLNCRYPGLRSDTAIQPVVLDPRLRGDMQHSKVRALAKEGSGKPPWILHAAGVDPASAVLEDDCYVMGGHPTASGRLEWSSLLKALARKNIRSLMIEGGATVINELLLEPELVDSVIVTIAPTWLGQGGVTVSPVSPHSLRGRRSNAARLAGVAWHQFGEDAVLCGRLSQTIHVGNSLSNKPCRE